jgi:hypothetical protein
MSEIAVFAFLNKNPENPNKKRKIGNPSKTLKPLKFCRKYLNPNYIIFNNTEKTV